MEKLKYTYGFLEGEVILSLDREVFTEEMAQEILNFHEDFGAFRDNEDDVLNACKKIAYTAFYVASTKSYNTEGVKREFAEELEGFPPLDGNLGIKLDYVGGYEFDPFYFELEEIVKRNST